MDTQRAMDLSCLPVVPTPTSLHNTIPFTPHFATQVHATLPFTVPKLGSDSVAHPALSPILGDDGLLLRRALVLASPLQERPGGDSCCDYVFMAKDFPLELVLSGAVCNVY